MTETRLPPHRTASELVVDHRVALVTGAGRGLGAAIAAELAAAGMGVMVVDRDPETARHGAAAIRAAGRDASFAHADVAGPAGAERAVAEAIDRYGRLDVLVNAADADVAVPLERTAGDGSDRPVEVDPRNPANLVQAALPHLRRGGDIVQVTSTSAAADPSWPEATADGASRAGRLGLSRALHTELGTRGIRVTAVVCGGMPAAFGADRVPDLDPGLLMDPGRVAAAIRWLLDVPRDVAVTQLTLVPTGEASWP